MVCLMASSWRGFRVERRKFKGIDTTVLCWLKEYVWNNNTLLNAIRGNIIPTLKTWAGRSEFKYEGTMAQGTTITFGNGNRAKITADQYNDLLNHFRGRTVDIGTSRTDPPRDSVGKWLQENVTKTATASYVGPILIHEGHAVKADTGSKIRFK